jgi:hypothetical protein
LEAIERRIAPFVRPRPSSSEAESLEWSSGDDTITGFRVPKDEGSAD